MSYCPAAPARPVLCATLAAASLLAARVTRAQNSTGVRPDPRPTSGPACVRALPDSVLTPVPVFVHTEVADSADRAARPTVDIVAEAVGQRLRAIMARADTLVAADALLRQTALGGGLRVVVRRGGGAAWHLADSSTTDSAGVRLLDRALRAATDSGDYFIADELFRGDSLAFRLDFAHPVPEAPGGRLRPVTVRNPAPVFTLRVAPERQAALVGALPLRYPASLQQGGFEGSVVVRFVVDAAGRAEPDTFRDAFPKTAASLAPHLRGAYATFLAAVRAAVRGARFTPAEVGGCRVRQLVQLPVNFALSR